MKEFKKTYLPEKYNRFSVKSFIENKKLRIEDVRKAHVQGIQCVKISLRIIEDKDGAESQSTSEFIPYNQNKVFTYRINNDDDEIFLNKLGELKQSIGHLFEISLDGDFEAYLYRKTFLTIIGDEFTVLDEKQETEKIEFSHRSLAKLDKYKTFDADAFFKETRPTIIGCHNEQNRHHLVFDAVIHDEENNKQLVSFMVKIDNYDDIPSKFLTENFNFNDVVSDYSLAHMTSSHYGSRWKFIFDSITIKAGTLFEEEYQLSQGSKKSNAIAHANKDERIEDKPKESSQNHNQEQSNNTSSNDSNQQENQQTNQQTNQQPSQSQQFNQNNNDNRSNALSRLQNI
ncbi:hypothetical protein ACR56S_03955 [Staphylococcus hominis]|uniref:hypothetical protein n=1 Tax=Staphylococcus hominis TaxID=1290 RepID=UPI003DA02A34